MKKKPPLRNTDYFDSLKANFKVEQTFSTEKEAWDWLYSLDLEYMDNRRFAFLDEPKDVAAYKEALSHGCCGYQDIPILVGGRKALIGCNYGH